MSSTDDLWKEYCDFFEQPFQRQLEINEILLREHLQRWQQTAQAKVFCPNGFRSIKEIPVTEFKDYQAFQDLGSRIQTLEKTHPRFPGELFWDYYERIGRIASKELSQYMIGEFSLVAKTSGTVSEPKWLIHGSDFWENFRRDVIATTLLACSDSWGHTKFLVGDKGLNFTASAPFLTGWGRKASQGLAVDVPPVDIMDNIPDTRRRFFVALEYIEKGHKVNVAGGIAPSVYLMCEYFSNPESLFEESYHSMDVGLAKLYVLRKWAEARVSRRSRNLRDFLDLKGLMIGGVDTTLYADYIRTKLEIEPFCIYGVTELGLPMFGSPEHKGQLLPNLRSCYLEFRDERGEMVDMTEVKPGNTYDIIASAFGGIVIRYDVGDMVRVIDIRDDGMPIFSFWGRKNAIVAVRGFLPRITEALAVQIMARAGLSLSDKWAFTKSIDDGEKILILMENTWGLKETEAAQRIFEALLSISEDFRHLVSENKIRDAQEILKVEYLKMGAFLRYSMKRAKEGYPIGQIKPPKIIPSERQDTCEVLRRL